MSTAPLKIFCMLVLFGCASGPVSVDEQLERDMKLANDAQNWALCEKAYARSGAMTIHKYHQHGKRARLQSWMIESDLRTNHCRMVLGKYWAD